MNGGSKANSQTHETDGTRRRTFGRRLAEAMKVRGMKQEDLAGKLGTTQSSVDGWVDGKDEPAAHTVFAVEWYLGTEPGALSRALG